MEYNKEALALITKYVKEDNMLDAILVYNRKTGKVIASTLDEKETSNQVKISQLAAKMDEKADRIDPSGNFRWDMVSFSRKIITSVRIHEDNYVDILFKSSKSPSGAIEDALEIALDAGELL